MNMPRKPPTMERPNNMSSTSIVNYKGRRIEKNIPFMDGELTIYKLPLGIAEEIQNMVKAQSRLEEEERDQLVMVKTVMKNAVEGGQDLEEDGLKSFPLGDLMEVVKAVMEFSGMAVDPKTLEETPEPGPSQTPS